MIEPWHVRPLAQLIREGRWQRESAITARKRLKRGRRTIAGPTTEENLTRGLSEDLLDAWKRLRDTAAEFGDQRIYASHRSIMFSRKACYFFVRPQRKF